MPPIFDGWVHPALAFGVLLAGVPLAIHLLNRQRHKPMAWAAMRFVLAAYRRTRRRAQLENLLLLLLRMAAVALLALALARPFIGERSPLAQLAESRRDVVIVIDASASTGHRPEVRSAFERIVERARALVGDLDGTRDDRVRVLLAGARARLVAWRRPDEAANVLATLDAPTDEALDLAAALGEVVRLAEEGSARGGASLEIRLLTDLQRRNFEDSRPDAGEPAVAALAKPGIFEQLDRLRELGARVLVEDFGSAEPTPSNLAVEAVEPLGAVLGAGAPIDVAVAVHNFGVRTAAGVRVSLEVDADQRLPYRTLDVPPRATARVTFQVVFRDPGAHVLTARIEADRLAADDARAHVLDVPPPIRVLLVDGEPAPEVDRDEVGYVAAVLTPASGDEVGASGGTLSPFEARVVEPHELRDDALDLEQFDVIVLANVEGLQERAVERLEARVAAGAALVFALGDRVEPRDFSARLFRADGSGLLPAELGARVGIARREGYFRVRQFDGQHPALAFFADEHWKPLLTEVPIYEFFTSRPIEGARVLAALDDDASSPLLVERDWARGKVYLWTTSLDAEWTRLPESPRTLVPLIHEWMRSAATPARPARNVPVGAPLIAEVESYPRSPTLVAPDGARRALQREPEALAPTVWRVAALDAGERAGVWRLELEGAPSLPFAVQIDPREGDLERLGATELATLHPALVLDRGDADRSAGDEDAPHRGELWRAIALACFAALALETLWAAWIGRRRRLVG